MSRMISTPDSAAPQPTAVPNGLTALSAAIDAALAAETGTGFGPASRRVKALAVAARTAFDYANSGLRAPGSRLN